MPCAPVPHPSQVAASQQGTRPRRKSSQRVRGTNGTDATGASGRISGLIPNGSELRGMPLMDWTPLGSSRAARSRLERSSRNHSVLRSRHISSRAVIAARRCASTCSLTSGGVEFGNRDAVGKLKFTSSPGCGSSSVSGFGKNWSHAGSTKAPERFWRP